ncbi:c-type cytochrome [Caulobacter sp. SLTY]|uniref:c-type cytochrome n=1 Tax=Caulobacter sp. SLTY TaxID=2683262 RepID=UPI001412F495|nr:c-type cytochrome [Caulobacter sp. SLTY]NBB14433.1 c-type cytochrome [Caulobacter sp. SLTY]
MRNARYLAVPMGLAAMILVSACVAGGRAAPEPDVGIGPDVRTESGLVLARRECAGCHAVEANGDSPRPMAPPFRLLATRLSGPKLDESLTMVADLGHGEMPPARLDQAELRVLAAYIDSLD